MVRDDLYSTVPSYFRCPISLDVMKSPVSLCTGVTYDRTSIQRWLDGGNNTCPATMQLLQNKDLIPNHTLHRLIQIWSDAHHSPPPPPLTTAQAAEIIRRLLAQLQARPNSFVAAVARDISTLTSFASGSEENARFLAASGARILPLLVSLAGKAKTDLAFSEKIIRFCNALLENRAKIDLGVNENNAALVESRIEITDSREFKDSIMIFLKRGRLELRIAVAKFLNLMATHFCIDMILFAEEEDDDDKIYSEMLRLVTGSGWNPEAMDAALSFLTRLALVKKNRAKFVRTGGVRAAAAALSEAEMSAAVTEKVLRLVEMMASGCREGREQICGGDGACMRAIVKKVLKVSRAATELAVTVLWCLCCVYGDKRASSAAAEGNGMGKILVVMQSDCSPAVRQMCGDLLRALRCSGSNKSFCASWYDTKATHIMPF